MSITWQINVKRLLNLIWGDYYAAQMNNFLPFKFQIFRSPAIQAQIGVNKIKCMQTLSGRALQ